MGQRPYAILCLGVKLPGEPGEEPSFYGDDEDFDDVLSREAGLQYSEDFSSEEFSAYYDKQKAIVAAAPVEMVEHGCVEYAERILAVNGAVFKTDWDVTLDLIPKELVEVPSEKLDNFISWCNNNDIDCSDIKWHLCAYLM